MQAKEETVYSTVRDIERTSYTVAGFSFVMAIVLAVVSAGRLSQPIARLAEGARRLAAGDFSRDIEVTSRNEIGELADTFNLMKAEIKSYVQRLQKAAEENKQMFMGAVKLPGCRYRRQGPLHSRSLGAGLQFRREDSHRAGPARARRRGGPYLGTYA